jgi:RNA polymerase sigma-70 factor (ECF subfamily)
LPWDATKELQPGTIFNLNPKRLGQPRFDDPQVMSMSDFALLLQNEIPRLRRYARALARDAARADDLVQSSLVRAIAKEHLWVPGTDLRAWLFTILHNQNVNEIRRSVREGVVVAVEDVAPVLTVAPRAGASLQLRDLERAIRLLPEPQRQVILLVGLEGMRYEEVAAVLDIPIGTVRSRLSRGREMLRRLMDVKEEPDVTFERPHGRQNSDYARKAA